MNLVLQRRPTVKRTTFGELFIDGAWSMYTLEDVIRELPGVPVDVWKIPGETAIPSGSYRLVVEDSPTFGPDTITVSHVPGFTFIRIHAGNDDADTAGCPLVGQAIHEEDGDGGNLLRSRLALAALKSRVVPAIKGGELVMLEIRNP